MSIVDQDGKPIAYGWNDEAAAERLERNPKLRGISDAEFERSFPELFQKKRSQALYRKALQLHGFLFPFLM
ncbi:MAG TPA: hypothetical protein VK633_04535 [Verrucomicrobiae bacterium]|nr:hypothetical protein [Verrucomicrobiae bacterium]